jgi:hypothetical protein
MDKKIRHIIQNIRSGQLLEESIPQMFNYLADDYYRYSNIQLSMNYYSFYEAYYDDENTWSKEAKNIILQLNEVIRDNILQNQSGAEHEEAIRKVDALRNTIMKHMNALTVYTDIFQIYEYVLNRIEYRFREIDDTVNEVEFSKEILRYIFDTEDNLVINEKIKDIIGQLPIRITKQKYFELLKESLQAYLGADQASFEIYLYMLRTSAMLYREEGTDTIYPGLWEKKEYLSHQQYKEMKKEDFDKALTSLQAATLTLETETTVYLSLQEMINEVYTMLLCSNYAGMVNSESEAAQKAAFIIIQSINKIFITDKKQDLSNELMEKLSVMEGVQEYLSVEIAALEDALFEVNKNYETLTQSLMLDQFMQVLLRSQKLLSNSIFIELEDRKAEQGIVDEELLAKTVEALEADMTSLFADQDKVITRAVMANTMNKMPVFFKNHKEVMDYILYSFDRCSDFYEKAACIEIISAIMSE